jgi:hypothetical protein
MVGIVAGTLTGMGLGVLLSLAICSGLEGYAGVRFVKEPLAIAAVGLTVGGVLGGLVGRRSNTR